MGRGGFEPPKQFAADLQSVPFDRFNDGLYRRAELKSIKSCRYTDGNIFLFPTKAPHAFLFQ